MGHYFSTIYNIYFAGLAENIVISNDDKLVVAYEDMAIKIWNTYDGKLIDKYKIQNRFVR